MDSFKENHQQPKPPSVPSESMKRTALEIHTTLDLIEKEYLQEKVYVTSGTEDSAAGASNAQLEAWATVCDTTPECRQYQGPDSVTYLLNKYEEEDVRFVQHCKITGVNNDDNDGTCTNSPTPLQEYFGYCTPNNFALIGAPKAAANYQVRLFEPMHYGITFRFTERALANFAGAGRRKEFEKQMEPIKKPIDMENLLKTLSSDNPELLIILAMQNARPQDAQVALVIDCLIPLTSPEEKEQARRLGEEYSEKARRELLEKDEAAFTRPVADDRPFVTKEEIQETFAEIEAFLNRRGYGPGQEDLCLAWASLSASSEERSGDEEDGSSDKLPVTTLLDWYEGAACDYKARFVQEIFIESLEFDCSSFHSLDNCVLLPDNSTEGGLFLFEPMEYKGNFTTTNRASRIFGSHGCELLGAVRNREQLLLALCKLAEQYPDTLIILGMQPVRGKPTAIVALLIDCLPALQSEEEKMFARKFGFMEAAADQAGMALKDPVGNETACCFLAAGFFQLRREHLSCRGCFPTSASRRNAKRVLMDKETCTFISNLDLTSEHKCGKAVMEKIIHIDLFFPDCLPDQWKNRSSMDWLKDSELRRQCIMDLIPGMTMDRKPSPIDARHVAGIQDREHVLDCGGFPEDSPLAHDIYNMIDEMENDEFCVGIHFGVRVEPDPDDHDDLGLESAMKLRTFKFRRPAVILEPEIDGNRCITIDRKRCANCGKEELLTRSFSTCVACKKVFYCGKPCQREHWHAKENGHKSQCKRKRRNI